MGIWSILCTAIWYILWPFDKFVVIWYIFPILVHCNKKNLATLHWWTLYAVMIYYTYAIPTLSLDFGTLSDEIY
jgi:hypothetical protein